MLNAAAARSSPSACRAGTSTFITALKEAKSRRRAGHGAAPVAAATTRSSAWSRSSSAVARKTPIILDLQNIEPGDLLDRRSVSSSRPCYAEAQIEGGSKADGHPPRRAGDRHHQGDVPDAAARRTTSASCGQDRGARASRRGALSPRPRRYLDRARASRPTTPPESPRSPGGRPGYIAELAEILARSRPAIGGDLADVSSRLPRAAARWTTERARGIPDAAIPKRASASTPPTPTSDSVTFLAALLGQAFPSGARRRHGRLQTARAIDDLLDAIGRPVRRGAVRRRPRHLDLQVQARLLAGGRARPERW